MQGSWLGASVLLPEARALTGLPQRWVGSQVVTTEAAGPLEAQPQKWHLTSATFCWSKLSPKVSPDSRCGGDSLHLVMQRAAISHCKGMWRIAAAILWITYCVLINVSLHFKKRFLGGQGECLLSAKYYSSHWETAKDVIDLIHALVGITAGREDWHWSVMIHAECYKEVPG